jgi:hypothetical protein
MHRTTVMAAFSLMAGVFIAGCGGKKAFDEAAALEAAGDRYTAIAAYQGVVETYGGGSWEDKANGAIDALVDVLVQEIVAGGAAGFELPEECSIGSAAGEPVEAGISVTLQLTCEERSASTSGRIIEDGKVWDLTPIEGVLHKEGECVFRSVANPFGDWNIPMAAEKCHSEQQKRMKALEQYKKPGGLADFQCDCRVGEATFEVPRGEPMWKTGPVMPELPPGALKEPVPSTR